ncbi:MAG: hypothetical protein JWL69_4360, partial [Phycisphaerales bacterium]|nr:hypothetical protein [Phycisphaerales bacterium]
MPITPFRPRIGVAFVAYWAFLLSIHASPAFATEPPAQRDDSASQSAATDGKLIPPTAAALKESVQLARDVYKDDFAKARKPEEKTQWARKLLELAAEEKDPAARFALLSLARDTAVDAGDLGTAGSAIDGLDSTFRVDAWQLKAEAATTIAKALRTPEGRKGFEAQVQPVIEQAVGTERYGVARQLADLALAVAHAAADAMLVRQANACVTRVREAEAAYAELKTAQT